MIIDKILIDRLSLIRLNLLLGLEGIIFISSWVKSDWARVVAAIGKR